MTILEFEKKIQKEIYKGLTIKPNMNTIEGLNGVYVDDMYLGVTLPPNEIMPEMSQFYMDSYGSPYRGVKEALFDIRAKLKSITQDKRNLFYDEA